MTYGWLCLSYFSAEFDECANASLSQCNQTCVNTFGSFRCECEHGFISREEGRICEGIFNFEFNTKKQNIVFFSTFRNPSGTSICYIKLDSLDFSRVFLCFLSRHWTKTEKDFDLSLGRSHSFIPKKKKTFLLHSHHYTHLVQFSGFSTVTTAFINHVLKQTNKKIAAATYYKVKINSYVISESEARVWLFPTISGDTLMEILFWRDGEEMACFLDAVHNALSLSFRESRFKFP